MNELQQSRSPVDGYTKDDLEQALAITPHFYRAVFDFDLWPAILTRLADAFDATVGQFVIACLDTNQFLATQFVGYPEEALKRWLSVEDFSEIDPRHRHLRSMPNRPISERMVISEAEWHSSPAFRDYLEPAGFDSGAGVMVHLEEENKFAVIGVVRRRECNPFTPEEVAKLHLYIPHFRQAMATAGQLYRSEAQNRTLHALFDTMRLAVVVTDRFGNVRFANHAADRLLHSENGVHTLGGRIMADHQPSNQALREAIFDVALGGPGAREHQPIALARHGTARPLLASVAHIGSESKVAGLGDMLSAAIFICDPDGRYEADEEILQRLFGLTQAEARVMALVAEGLPPRAVADRLDRSYETVRTHLKSVYAKSGTGSQAELTRVVSSVIPST